MINVEIIHKTSNKVYSFDRELSQQEIDTFQDSDGEGYTYVKDYVLPVEAIIKPLATLAAEFKVELEAKGMPLSLYNSVAGKLLGLEFALSNNRIDAVIDLLIKLPTDDVYTQAFKDSYLTQLNLLL
jgi:hypothetical protein